MATVLTLKADPSKSWTCGYDGIISTRLLEHVLKCEKIKDDEKVALCKHVGSSGAAKKWKEEYDARHLLAKGASPAKKLSAAENWRAYTRRAKREEAAAVPVGADGPGLERCAS